MREVAPEIITQVTKRQGLLVRNLIWFIAKNRLTGVAETLGVWNGDDTATFVIDGQSRVYVGGGGFMQIGDLKQEQGLTINSLSVNANPISTEFELLLRGYEPKFARVEVHEAFYDPETNNLVADPLRIFKGWIDTLSIRRAIKNEDATAVINLVGHTRVLTRKNPAKRSNENQMKRQSGDRFLENAVITGTIQTPWGQAGAGSGPILTVINAIKANIRGG